MQDLLSGLLADPIVLAGLVAGVLSIIAYAPYIRDTIAGTTRPDRACWLIWAVLASISGASNLYEGASVSLFFIGVQVLGTLIIFVLSIWRGAGQYLSRENGIILGVSAVGLVSWYLTDSAVYALAISISVSALGGMGTIRKAYLDPGSETQSTWLISSAAALLGVVSVGAADPVLLAYPVYLLVLYLGIVVAMWLGERAQMAANADRFVWYSRRAARARAMRYARGIKMPPPVEAPMILRRAA